MSFGVQLSVFQLHTKYVNIYLKIINYLVALY